MLGTLNWRRPIFTVCRISEDLAAFIGFAEK